MNKKRIVRIVTALLAVLLIGAAMLSLTSCAGSKEEKIESSWTAADADAATYFTRILPMSAEAREKFVAASRGYNMSAEGFDKNADAPDLGVVDLEGAKAALELVKPQDDASKVKFEEFRTALTAEQVKDIVTRMGETVSLEADNGPIDTLLVWIGKFLQILTKITGGKYVLGLLVFALVVEIVMLPFGIKQQKNSIKQAKLRPKEMAIRNKYKGRNDQATQQKMAQEIQKMYQEEGYNPMGGCLPLLIQLPVILALYQIVIDPLRYVLGKAATLSSALTTYCTTAKAAGGLGLSIGNGKGTIELLSQAGNKLEGLKSFAYYSNASECYADLTNVAIPDFELFGQNMGNVPSFTSILVLVPILTFVFYFASMKLNRKFTYQPAVQDAQMGCSNNMMDITMPLMSVYIAFIVPAAVGIYWMFKSVLSTLKSFIMSKVMPVPVFTEEDYKAAEKALKGKGKSESRPVERTAASGTKPRSLHYIDEDDEPLPPPVPERVEEPAKKKVEKDEPATEVKPSQVPNLKEDRKNTDNKNK
ncbi:MAG: YidC/Oxa1 family membrane protein insertase [Ruminococcaceae bacterium]|nr:YidC/Oxa1 family membrane protein insertase [Oscillospiraceae bacterium]